MMSQRSKRELAGSIQARYLKASKKRQNQNTKYKVICRGTCRPREIGYPELIHCTPPYQPITQISVESPTANPQSG